MDACRHPVGTHNRFPASRPWEQIPGKKVLPTLPLLFALVSVCANTPAVVAKGSNNRCEETKSLQEIPDTTIFVGKIFYYPVPVSAFQGTKTQYKVTLASGAGLPKWLDFNPNTNTLQGLPMAGESGVYLLNIAASGRTCTQQTPRAVGNFTIHVQDSIFSLDMEGRLNYMPNSYHPDRCGKEVPISSAEIILSTGVETLEVQERLYIVCTMSEYLRLESSLLTLLQYSDLAYRSLESLTILAEDTEHINFMVNHYVGLSWPVQCGGFTVLHQFTEVLRHNIDSHHLSQLLGYEIAGWRILRRGDYERKSPRRQRRRLMITPTPTLKPIRITQRPVPGDSSRPLSPAVLSHLLTHVVSPTQSLSSFCEESVTMGSYKMQNNIHLTSQEKLVTLETDSAWDKPTPVSITFGDLNTPELSPSLMAKTFLFTELEVLPTRAFDTSLLLEQLEPHMSETDLRFLSSTSKASTYHFLQDITSDTDQLSRPVYTWVINTFHGWPHSSAEAFPSKTKFHVFYPEAMSISEMPDYSNEAKSHFPELEMLSSASLSPETLSSIFPKASIRATTWSDFTFPTTDTFPPVLTSSSLSQDFTNDYEQLPHRPFMTISQPSGFLFARGKSTVYSMTQAEVQTLYPKVRFGSEATACFSSTLYTTFPSKAEAPYEQSLITPSHPDTAPVLTLPVYFSSFGLPELSRATSTLCSYSSSMLRTQMQSANILSFGTKELRSDSDLGTRRILPNVTEPTLRSHEIPDIVSDVVEVPLVTLLNATSHLFSSLPEVFQTLLPSHQDPSTLLFPTSERLQPMRSARIPPPFLVSKQPQNTTPGQANTSPKVVHSIQFLTATIGRLFFFPVPANAFYDEEDGNSTQLSLQIIPADGSPLGSESWLQFNTSQQTMHGYPLDIDFQYSPQEFVLSATDSGGLAAWESFTIELLKPINIPCHLYTIRTKNSYYSFLRERKRISLFLEKLSLYLSSSSPKDIMVTALKPGSTVISWYNSSLCTSANSSSSWCAKDEIQEVLQKLRVPSGYVSQHFVQAMLPEYKIDVNFNISYSEVCLPPTKPFNDSFNSTVPTLHDKNDSTVRKTLSALLSSLCISVVVVLVILGYCFCKHHRKISGSQFMTFQRNSQLGHTDVELDVLKPRKAAVHECKASPQLWIPPSVSLTSQEQHSRSTRLLHTIPSFQPPKYQLPPHYQEGMTTRNDQGNIHRLKLRSFK